MTGQQTRLESLTVTSLNDNIAQFKNFVKEFKEKNKINYNLTEDAAEQAAREAAEVESIGSNISREAFFSGIMELYLPRCCFGCLSCCFGKLANRNTAIIHTLIKQLFWQDTSPDQCLHRKETVCRRRVL